MSIKNLSYTSHTYSRGDPYPFPQIEQEVYQECRRKIEELKTALLKEAEAQANQKLYSEVESYGKGLQMIASKCNTVKEEIIAQAEGEDKIEIIDYAWRELQGDLFSPFHFLGSLMNALQGDLTKLIETE